MKICHACNRPAIYWVQHLQCIEAVPLDERGEETEENIVGEYEENREYLACEAHTPASILREARKEAGEDISPTLCYACDQRAVYLVRSLSTVEGTPLNTQGEKETTGFILGEYEKSEGYPACEAHTPPSILREAGKEAAEG